MNELTRQQFCAALGISESTVYRLELLGLPYTPIGIRGKRYNLAECKEWLRDNGCRSGQTQTVGCMSAFKSAGAAFTDACRKVQVRATPS